MNPKCNGKKSVKRKTITYIFTRKILPDRPNNFSVTSIDIDSSVMLMNSCMCMLFTLVFFYSLHEVTPARDLLQKPFIAYIDWRVLGTS